jgi:hypothetical protein
VALFVIGLTPIFLPTNQQGGTMFSTFFGSPWIQGITGSTTNPQTGETTQQTLLTSGSVNFKMSLVAAYSDNSPDETIFEKSSLPGLAVISVHGHPLKAVTAYAVAAVQTDQPLPASAIAHFYLNFSAYIDKLGATKWRYLEMTVPLINNGRLAIASLPPLRVVCGQVDGDHTA